jgi:L-amino acid N-acyltransferase YncA
MIRSLVPSDWPDVARIYAEGIESGHATFETEVPDWETWDSAHLEKCRLVTETESEVLGWAALSPVSRRQVYRGVAEVSVYVGSAARGRGVGSDLLGALIACSETSGFWTLQTSIFPENESSVALHAKHGFRQIGIRERIGSHHGRWRDTVLMERRSPSVGR